MVRIRIGWSALVAVCCASSAALGACLVEDEDFATADGGCKDLSTGLVFSADLSAYGAGNFGIAGVDAVGTNNACNYWLNNNPANGGGYTDWRTMTLGEVQESLANGLSSHLDIFLNGSPDNGEYRWTKCTQKKKGKTYIYGIRFTDGSVEEATPPASRTYWMVCVRGLPADCADCPGGCGPGKKNRSAATSALSQTATGALLLLPLGLVVAARCLRPRRP